MEKTVSRLGDAIFLVNPETRHIENCNRAEVIAMTHHERWDGTGYPKKLEQEAIPLVGRIVAVVDVFDALASKRPYKKPFTLERSLSIVRKNTGTHFDPAVVEAFFAVKDEISDIQRCYAQDSASHLFKLAGFQHPPQPK